MLVVMVVVMMMMMMMVMVVVNVQVFQVCGQPTLGGVRSRRKANPSFSSPYNWHHHDIQRGMDVSATSDEGLESLVHDIHERLLTTRDFWTNLPDSVCSQLAAAPFELTNCWNGHSVSRCLFLFLLNYKTANSKIL